jgi:hypothetical protein
MVLMFGGLDLGVDGREVSGLTTYSAAVLLREKGEATNNGSLDSFVLRHSDLPIH